jgi:putative FmdB family regulatory protein
MPFYEYRCDNCGHEMEALQKISDAPLVDCPECAQPALKKLVSAAGFRLKGSGWYETDFKGGKKKNLHDSGEKKGTGEKKDTGTSKESKKETGGGEKKPDAKPKASAAG